MYTVKFINANATTVTMHAHYFEQRRKQMLKPIPRSSSLIRASRPELACS
eukprot:COSAG02_NODE_2728_length_8148_cov_19.461921_6_plen_50_part_00